MPRTQNEGLAAAPLFTPHRVRVLAADPAAPSSTIKFNHGLDSRGWDDVAAQIKLDGADTTIEVLYFSDLDGEFVQAQPVETFALTESRAIKFTPGGRRFFLHVIGTFTQVDIDVAGVALRAHEHA